MEKGDVDGVTRTASGFVVFIVSMVEFVRLVLG